jgi:hypothetical protein
MRKAPFSSFREARLIVRRMHLDRADARNETRARARTYHQPGESHEPRYNSSQCAYAHMPYACMRICRYAPMRASPVCAYAFERICRYAA